MIICVLKRILHKKKVILIQLLESPIPPFTAAGGTPTPPDDHLQPPKGHEKCIFETLHNEIKCVLSMIIKFQWKKDQNFHICLQSGPKGSVSEWVSDKTKQWLDLGPKKRQKNRFCQVVRHCADFEIISTWNKALLKNCFPAAKNGMFLVLDFCFGQRKCPN